jgi:hypothetical protein
MFHFISSTPFLSPKVSVNIPILLFFRFFLTLRAALVSFVSSFLRGHLASEKRFGISVRVGKMESSGPFFPFFLFSFSDYFEMGYGFFEGDMEEIWG